MVEKHLRKTARKYKLEAFGMTNEKDKESRTKFAFMKCDTFAFISEFPQ